MLGLNVHVKNNINIRHAPDRNPSLSFKIQVYMELVAWDWQVTPFMMSIKVEARGLNSEQ